MKYALATVLLLAACKGEEVNAKVNCKITNDIAVECVVHQDQGKSEIEVCWDFAASCPNGSTLKAERACQKVKDGGTETLTIPKAKLAFAGPECDGNPAATLTNLTINGKPSTK